MNISTTTSQKLNTKSQASFRQTFFKVLYALPVVYALLWCVSHIVVGPLIDPSQIIDGPITGTKAIQFAVAFFFFFTPLLYLAACAVAGRWLVPKPSELILYVGATFMGGVFGEIIVGTLGKLVLNISLWRYEYAPRHGAFTSSIGVIMWPMYGMYLYFFHQAMQVKGSVIGHHISLSGIFIAIDALVLEMLANVFSLSLFGSYFFKYNASDLMHMTSAQIFLPYVAFGVLGAWLLKLCNKDNLPKKSLGVIFYMVGLVLVFSG